MNNSDRMPIDDKIADKIDTLLEQMKYYQPNNPHRIAIVSEIVELRKSLTISETTIINNYYTSKPIEDVIISRELERR